MGKKNIKSEEKKLRSSDFSNFNTINSRPTGLHQIFASFNNIIPKDNNIINKSDSLIILNKNKLQNDYIEDISKSQQDIIILLNKLIKKDSITKLKALETFNENINNISSKILEEYIIDIIHIFKKLSIVEPIKKIRLEFGLLLYKIVNKLKKKLQYYLESFITYWWISMHDESPEISEAYLEAFRNLFPSNISEDEFKIKTLKILNYYFVKISSDYLEFFNRDIESYSKEWLETFGKTSQNSASIADMHNRLFYSISHSLRDMFVYVRMYKNEFDFQLQGLVNIDFVYKANELSRSNSFKKRLSCLLMLVEMVKVLPSESLNLLDVILTNSVNCVKKDTEPALIYHQVRLICACTRENNTCISKFLSNYDSLVTTILTNFGGEYGNKVDLYTLFPSLYMYIDPDYFDQNRDSFEGVLIFLCELMAKEVSEVKRSAYVFDLDQYRNLGSSMLCSFYKLLLLSKKNTVDFVLMPLKKLCQVTENTRDFLWNYPLILTQFIEESNLLQQQIFVELLKEILGFSEESPVLIASILSDLYAKYGSKLNEVYAGFEESYKSLFKEVVERLPEYLVQHLEHKGDMSLDIDQLVKLLNRTPVELPHEIPRILFDSHSHPDFPDDYNLLLDVYKSLNVPYVSEVLEEDLDDKLFLFYSLVLLEKSPSSVVSLFHRKFDLKDRCTFFLVIEFINGCRELNYSNELVQFARRHLNMKLLGHLFEYVDYTNLTVENKRLHEGLLLIYQLFQNKKLNFNNYDVYLVQGVLTLYLYQVLRENLSDFEDFSDFVLKEFCDSLNKGVEDHLSPKVCLSPKGSVQDSMNNSDCVSPKGSVQDSVNDTFCVSPNHNVESCLGDNVEDFVNDKVEESLNQGFKNSVESSINDNVVNSVNGNLEHSLKECVDISPKGNLEDSVNRTFEHPPKHSVCNSLNNNVNHSIRVSVDECMLGRLDGVETKALVDFEKFSKNLGILLGSMFSPDFVMGLVKRVLGLMKDVDSKILYRRCYHLMVNVYLKYDVSDKSVDIEGFLELFTKCLVTLESNLWVSANADFTILSSMYRFCEEETYEKFLKNILMELMGRTYTCVKELEESVRMFEYFYGSLSSGISQSLGLIEFIKSHFTQNLWASYFLASLLSVESNMNIGLLELSNFFKMVCNFRKLVDCKELSECESYTFLNNITLGNQILLNYKNYNKLENLELKKLYELLIKGIKLEENIDIIPHTKNIECVKDSEEYYISIISYLLLNIFKIYLKLNLKNNLNNLWSKLLLYNFIILFPIEINIKNKNDIYFITTNCIKIIYDSITFYGISTNIITRIINFQIQNGLIEEYVLGSENDLNRLFEIQNGIENNFNKNEIIEKFDSLCLGYWIAVCHKIGQESIKLDQESLSEFSKSVCILLQNAYILKPSSYYVNTYISKLWLCKSLYPSISESGIFCNFPNHEYICIINTFPEIDFFYDLKSCKMDYYKLLYTFNNYSNKQLDELELNDIKEELTLEDLKDDTDIINEFICSSDKINSNCNDEEIDVNLYDVKNGFDLIKLYLGLIIGPYLTGEIMRTYICLEMEDMQEIQKCLISWLTVFNLHVKYKKLGNLNCANALVKLVTQKPYELGEYVNESFQDNLSESIQDNNYEVIDMSFLYSRQFGLRELYGEEYYIKDFYKSSLLDLFLQLLIQCLEKMLIKDQKFCQTVKLVYYKAAKIFPIQVSEMWSNCKNSYVKKNIKKFTKHEVTQKLIKDELDSLKIINDLTVFYDSIKKEVTAKLVTKKEITAKITIKVPSAFPLEPLTFVSQEKKNHKWIIFSHSEANRSGIAQGLLLWYNNVVKYYQGIDECPICYSIVHAQFQSIPTKPCKVCKYKFHKECLFKWFRNAAKAKCPLCQSQVSFL